MKVIGAGFGRTGTLSLKAALEELGFGPCYHMVEVFEHPEHVAVWQAAGERRPVDWKSLFDGYGAAVDFPTCSFYEQLIDVYPEAKVVLTVRDSERWYESVKNTVWGVSHDADALFDDRRRMIDTIVWRGTFDGRFEDKKHAIAVYEAHNEAVKRRVPKDRLLVFDLKQGWAPLCEFLGVPVPKDRPIPHLNDTQSFLEMIASRGKK